MGLKVYFGANIAEPQAQFSVTCIFTSFLKAPVCLDVRLPCTKIHFTFPSRLHKHATNNPKIKIKKTIRVRRLGALG